MTSGYKNFLLKRALSVKIFTAILLLLFGTNVCSGQIKKDGPTAVFHSIEIHKGDSVGQFLINEINIDRKFDDDWSGYIIFTGAVEISGRYGEHPAFPDLEVVCFFPDENSVTILPKFVKDERNGWFSFSNAEDDTLLSEMKKSKTGRARIIISDFFYAYAPSDVENSAQLKKIIELKPENVNSQE